MLTFLRKHLAVVAAGIAFAALALTPAVAFAEDADIRGGLSCGTDFQLSTSGEGCDSVAEEGEAEVQNLITVIVNVLSVIVGIVAVIMIIWGGFRYISSGGDSGKITAARNTIVYAVVGLVIVALSQFLVQFVLAQVITE